jgi:eukaryotic-like serine/threonine-protein kinase
VSSVEGSAAQGGSGESASEVVAGIREGDVLAGKYRVDRVLGAGGMGVVVAAHHLQLDARVAIKLLRPEMLENQEAVGRFAREARAAVRITSEHVARVFDVGTMENGASYIVMEYLDGVDLAGMVQARGPLPVGEAVEFILQACEAIAEAHGLGIVHRDLKPANLFSVRRPDGTVSIKVLDFGISKLTSLGASVPEMAMTKTTAMLGSPFYMSPEQMESSRGVDARTDIWALGIILHELLTGRVPFDGNTLPEVCMRIATQRPPSLRNFRADAPAALDAVILRCLEKDRDRRYANIGELALALREFGSPRAKLSVDTILSTIRVSGLSTTAPGMPLQAFHAGAETPVHASPETPFGQTTPGTGGSKAAAIVGLIGAVLVVGVIGLVFALRKPSGAPADPSRSVVAVQPAASAPPLPEPAPSAPLPSAVIPPLPSDTVAPPPPAAPSPVTKKVVPGEPAPRAALGTPPAVAPARPGKPKLDCDPNFTLDAQGEKHFKPECF